MGLFGISKTDQRLCDLENPYGIEIGETISIKVEQTIRYVIVVYRKHNYEYYFNKGYARINEYILFDPQTKTVIETESSRPQEKNKCEIELEFTVLVKTK